MRMLFLIIALCASAYLFFFHDELLGPPVYREVRFNTLIEGRQLRLVAVEELRGMDRCENEPPLSQFTDLCHNGLECSTTSVQCKTTISPRYLAMLNQENQSTQYLHAFAGHAGRVIYTLWGVDSSESAKLCRQWLSAIQQDVKLGDPELYRWQCI